MIGDIRRHLAIIPFSPFTIRMASGQEYPVPTIDHVYLPPVGGRVVVSDNEGYIATLPGLLISELIEWPPPKATSKKRATKRS